MARTHIPSPEEIAERIRERALSPEEQERAHEARIKQVAAVAPKMRSLEEKVQELAKEVARPKKKRTAAELRAAMDLMMEKHDFSPIEELIEIAIDLRDRPMQIGLRVSILQDLASYVQPKLKSVEMQGQVDHQHHIHIIRYGPDGTIAKEALPAPGPLANQIDNRESRPVGVVAPTPSGDRPVIVDVTASVVDQGVKEAATDE